MRGRSSHQRLLVPNEHSEAYAQLPFQCFGDFPFLLMRCITDSAKARSSTVSLQGLVSGDCVVQQTATDLDVMIPETSR
jgi:hypothetical protein